MVEATVIVAFIAGIVSFVSPCVLPLIPGFLAYLSGTSAGQEGARLKVFLNSVAFVLGFSVVFALLGVLLNTVLERVSYNVQTWLSRLGGIIIILFALYILGLIKIGFLEREHKLKVKKKSKEKKQRCSGKFSILPLPGLLKFPTSKQGIRESKAARRG